MPTTAESPPRRALPRVSLRALLAFRMRRQRLVPPFDDAPAHEVVHDIGWLHAPGSSSPYLSLWARCPAFETADLDEAIHDDGALVVMTALRGDPMVVPRAATGLAHQSVRAERRDVLRRMRRAGVTVSEDEVRALTRNIRSSLHVRPMTRHALRRTLSTGQVRSLGDVADQQGFPDTLTLVLAHLEHTGAVVRSVARGARLDGESAFVYGLADEILGAAAEPELSDVELPLHLADYYMRVHSPARLRDFAWWSGLPVGAAREALDVLARDLEMVLVEGLTEPFHLPRSALAELLDAETDEDAARAVALLPCDDGFCRWLAEPAAIHVAEPHRHKPFALYRGQRLAARVLSPVMLGGRVVGIWEWRPTEARVDIELFDPADRRDADVVARVEAQAARLAEFIGGDLRGRYRALSPPYDEVLVWRLDDLRQFWARGAAEASG